MRAIRFQHANLAVGVSKGDQVFAEESHA